MPSSLDRIGIIQRAAELLAVGNSAPEPRLDACLEHAALKLSEGPTHLKHELARWRSRVDRLLIEVQINAAVLQTFDKISTLAS